jgi:hypothetical protein
MLPRESVQKKSMQVEKKTASVEKKPVTTEKKPVNIDHYAGYCTASVCF